jgi:hypothetical protein
MKRFYMTVTLSLLTTIFSVAQTFEWLRTVPIDYEYNPDMIRYSAVSDQQGNVYFFGLEEFETFYNEAMGSQFIKKFNAGGETLWQRTISGEAAAGGIYTSIAGDIFLYGEMHSDLDFWGQLTLYVTGITTNAFLVKMDAAGDIGWGLNLEDLPFESGVISDIVSVEPDLLYFAYSTWLSSNIVVMNTDGEYITSIVQENVALVSGLDADEEGNIYAAGGCAGWNASFGGVSYPAPFPYTSYVVKYNSDYEPEWVKFIEDVTCSVLKVKYDHNGGLYLSSQLFAGTLLDTIQLQGASWVYDFYLTRLNPVGEFLWALECPQVLTGDATIGKQQYLSVDPEGNALLAGFTRGTIDWGDGIVSNTQDYYYNIMIWNVNPLGEINWIKTAASEGYDDSHSISCDPQGNVYLAGIAGGTAVFDTIIYETDDFVYPFLAKLNSQAMTAVAENDGKDEMDVFPNPANDRIFVHSNEPGEISIYNLQGNKMMELKAESGWQTVSIDDLPGGSYLLRFQSSLSPGFKISRIIVR